MAYCGKCGQKNPEGASFCFACGSPLSSSSSQSTYSRSEDSRFHEDSEGSEDIMASKEDTFRTVLKPRREATPPPLNTTPPPHNRESRGREEPPRIDDGSHERPSHRTNERKKEDVKKKTTGYVRTLGISIILISLAYGAYWLLFKSSSDSGSNTAKYERIMDDKKLKEYADILEIPADGPDAAPQNGTYSFSGDIGSEKHKVSIKFMDSDVSDNRIAGKFHMAVDEGEEVTFYYCYCGHGIYGVYDGPEDIGKEPKGFFLVKAGGKSIIMEDGQVELKYE